MSILIKDLRFLVDRKGVRKNMSIYIEEGKIVELGKEEADVVIDGSDLIAIPGFVNLFYSFETSEKEELTYWMSILKFVEALKNGVTTVVNTSAMPEEVAKAASAIGIRAFVGYELFDNYDEEARELCLKKAEKFVKFLGLMRFELVKPIIGLKSLRYASMKLYEGVKEISGMQKVIFSAGEDIEARRWIEREYGYRPIEALEHKKVLGANFIARDVEHVEGRELAALKVSRGSAVFLPTYELLKGSLTQVHKFIKKGVKLGMGTAKFSSNVFRELRTGLAIRLIAQDFDPFKLFELATYGGASILGVNSGELKPGAAADLVLLRIEEELLPISSKAELVEKIVFNASPRNVELAIVNGSIPSLQELEKKARARILDLVLELLNR